MTKQMGMVERLTCTMGARLKPGLLLGHRPSWEYLAMHRAAFGQMLHDLLLLLLLLCVLSLLLLFSRLLLM